VSGAARPTIELELFESSTVKSFIAKKGGKLSLQETARIVKPVAEALSYIHALETGRARLSEKVAGYAPERLTHRPPPGDFERRRGGWRLARPSYPNDEPHIRDLTGL
jgi:hypothetical protein